MTVINLADRRNKQSNAAQKELDNLLMEDLAELVFKYYQAGYMLERLNVTWSEDGEKFKVDSFSKEL